jgi:hypothetical protein
VIGNSLAVSFEDWAAALCEGCALEAAVSIRHESEHHTGSNSGDAPGIDYSTTPHIGNFVMLDLAGRLPIGDFALALRLQGKFFLPAGGGYTFGPGLDLTVRYQRWASLQPFASFFYEYLFGSSEADITVPGRVPDARFFRNLTGVILPSRLGDLYLFLSADVGHRKGLMVFQREASLGLGARVAFF